MAMNMATAMVATKPSPRKSIRRRGVFARRSAGQWASRGALAIFAIVLGALSVTHTLADVIRQTDPARAHALAASDGQITSLLAERRLETVLSSNASAPVTRLARLAVRQDPTAVQAVATLGFLAQLRSDTATTRRLFNYSQFLSRRHLKTQLWAVEDAVARGDVARALRHYDVALRTSKSAPDLLFPVLSAAIADPAIRSNLVSTMRRQPAWAPDFVSYVATDRKNPSTTALFLAELRSAGLSVPLEATATIISQLIENNTIPDAWRYYGAVHPGADPRRSRDPYFMGDSKTGSLFDWSMSTEAGVSVSIQRNGSRGVFAFSVPSGAGGMLIRQVQVLPPGAYWLQGHSVGVDQPDQTRPYWTLTCHDGRELGRLTIPNSVQAGGRFSGKFDIPSRCSAQTLSLNARPTDALLGVTGQIDYVQLAPLIGG